jgi:hypothetical protein
MTTKKTVIQTPGLVLASQYEMTIAAAVISAGSSDSICVPIVVTEGKTESRVKPPSSIMCLQSDLSFEYLDVAEMATYE